MNVPIRLQPGRPPALKKKGKADIPDASRPEQITPPRRASSPQQRRLAMALLEGAYLTLRKGQDEDGMTVEWITETPETTPTRYLTFQWMCDTLNLDEEWLRKMLVTHQPLPLGRWREKFTRTRNQL